MRNSKLAFLGLAFFYTTAIFATTQHALSPQLSMELEFPPHEAQVFSNNFIWTINAHCQIHSQEENNPISAKALKKYGSVNGNKLSKDEVLFLDLKNNETLAISASPGASVELVNLGDTVIKAHCKNS